jgi:hypothetical protein
MKCPTGACVYQIVGFYAWYRYERMAEHLKEFHPNFKGDKE